MTPDEAIEILGGLVSRCGGEGDDALDVIKDALGSVRKQESPDAIRARMEGRRQVFRSWQGKT